jgi:hypothetical protein
MYDQARKEQNAVNKIRIGSGNAEIAPILPTMRIVALPLD